MREPIRVQKQPDIIRQYQLIDPPLRQLGQGLVRDVYAARTETGEDGQTKQVVYASIDKQPNVDVEWVGEFNHEPTGRVTSASRVSAVIGGEVIYTKRTRNDLPLGGLRFAIAQRKATRKLKKLL
jgi:hypothetical protein